MKKQLITIALGALISSVSYGESIQCNKNQTKCQTESNEWTIGDKVGVFNTEGELVAVGKVQEMRQARRTVKISERHGRIKRSHRFALLGNNNATIADTYKGDYKVYNKPSNMSVGANAGVTRVAIGAGTPGVEFTGFGQWRKWQGIQLVGRGTYVNASGDISRTTSEIETEEFNMHGFGATGGAAYTLRENKPIGFRGELGLGFMYSVADIAGDSALIEDSGFDSHLNDGFGPYVRASGSVLVNYGKWHVNFELASSVIHKTNSTTIGGGIIRDLK